MTLALKVHDDVLSPLPSVEATNLSRVLRQNSEASGFPAHTRLSHEGGKRKRGRKGILDRGREKGDGPRFLNIPTLPRWRSPQALGEGPAIDSQMTVQTPELPAGRLLLR